MGKKPFFSKSLLLFLVQTKKNTSMIQILRMFILYYTIIISHLIIRNLKQALLYLSTHMYLSSVSISFVDKMKTTLLEHREQLEQAYIS